MQQKFLAAIRRARERSSLFDRLYRIYTGHRLPWGMTPHQIVYRSIQNPWMPLLYLHNFYNRTVRDRGIDVMGRDWDTLIILDSCTYDLFTACSELPGELSRVISPGGATGEFLFSTVGDADLTDVVYVTASPGIRFVEDHRTVNLHAIDDVWRDGWDEEPGTVRPETMVERALAAHEEYPDKRIVVHFMQPHFPFIGPTGQSIEHRAYGGRKDSSKTEGDSIWTRLSQGDLSETEVRTAYRENLELALPHVSDLADAVDGRVVVTSDHGNAFGRWGVYGHTPGVFLPEIVEVPWLELPFEEARTTTVEDATLSEEESEMVQERLEDLGYVGKGDKF